MLQQLDNGAAQASSDADRSQLGVQEFDHVVRRLSDLLSETNPDRLRRELFDLEEAIYEVRPKLIHRGRTPASGSAMDLFLQQIHHLIRNVGTRSRMRTLERIRADLAERRQRLVSEGRLGRIERIDYLAANMDFVVNYDCTAMLLADGKVTDQAIERAEKLQRAGNGVEAAAVAAGAYEALLAAGMRDAVLALTHKLTTRCEFAILATVNIKPLAAYWEVIERLESFMPGAPPRELRAETHGEDVHLWWFPPSLQWWPPPDEPVKRPEGFHVYRATAQATDPQRLTDQPLSAEAGMFLDRPNRPGRYRYTVTAIVAPDWESPHSHPVEITWGGDAPGPRIVACQPPSVAEAGQAMRVRVVATGERPVMKLDLHYRRSPQSCWQTLSMLRRFRRSYHAHIPADQIEPGILEFFVAAMDESGRTTNWPATATLGRPWTVSVVAPC